MFVLLPHSQEMIYEGWLLTRTSTPNWSHLRETQTFLHVWGGQCNLGLEKSSILWFGWVECLL